tara:strand:- start:90 stop:572 length:483 start_codon:yes stop_codon:yes gene_type:complete
MKYFLSILCLFIFSCDSGGGDACEECSIDKLLGEWSVESETGIFTSQCDIDNVFYDYDDESFYTINENGTFNWSDSQNGNILCEGIYFFDENCVLDANFNNEECFYLENFATLLDITDGGDFDVCFEDRNNLTLSGTFNLELLSGLPQGCQVTVTYEFKK